MRFVVTHWFKLAGTSMVVGISLVAHCQFISPAFPKFPFFDNCRKRNCVFGYFVSNVSFRFFMDSTFFFKLRIATSPSSGNFSTTSKQLSRSSSVGII
jgi:hypothetical protein